MLGSAAATCTRTGEAPDRSGAHLAVLRPSASFADGWMSHIANRDHESPASFAHRACGWRQAQPGGLWTAAGDCVGWLEGEHLYLEPTAAFRAAQNVGRDIGESIAVSAQTLRKRLSERGLLQSHDTIRETLTVGQSIGGSQKTVLHLHRRTLLPDETRDEELPT